MSNLVVNLADAVTAELAGVTFSQSFAPQRRYRPRYELRDLKDLTVTVVPKSLSLNAATRNGRFHDVAIDIAMQQRLADEHDATIDPLMQLVLEIVQHLSQRKLPGVPSASLIELTNDPIYAVEHLDEMRVFTSVITATYRTLQ